MIFSLRHDWARARFPLLRLAGLTRCSWALTALVETRASWGLAVMPAGYVHTGPASGNEKKINAGEQERGCWDHLFLAAVAGQWLSVHLSIKSLCWPVALKFSSVLHQSVIALCLSWPGLWLIIYTFHRLAQKVVGIFREQDNYFSSASNKTTIYMKRPRVLKIELEVVDEALLNFLLPFQYHSQFLLLFLIINWRKFACCKPFSYD